SRAAARPARALALVLDPRGPRRGDLPAVPRSRSTVGRAPVVAGRGRALSRPGARSPRLASVAPLFVLCELHAAAEPALQAGLDHDRQLAARLGDPAGVAPEDDLRDERDARLARVAVLDHEHAEDVADLDDRAKHPAAIDRGLRRFDLLLVLGPRRGVDE